MKRRTFISTVCGTISLSGCITTVQSVVDSSQNMIEDTQFTVYGPGSNFFERISSESPEVTFHHNKTKIEIRGKLCVGSSSKYKADLKKSAHHRDSDALIVHVGRKQIQEGGTDDMSEDAYNIEITYEKELPHHVVVLELGQCSVKTTTADSF